MKKILLLIIILAGLQSTGVLFAQTEEEEQILFYQMEPLDDSLFLLIQNEVFIDPPDPKAEIIADLRDPNNQTVSIKGVLYPYLAFTPETRAKIATFPFKINLEEDLHYGSVFSRVFEKIRINKIVGPATLAQISPGLHYINPFLQLFGGERFGVPIKKDIGISFGLGTPYSGPLETNLVEANFHILGFSGGAYSSVNAFTEIKQENNHNNLYGTVGYQISYVLPFGNFFEIGYLESISEPTASDLEEFQRYDTPDYQAKIIDGSYFNWEFRYPISFFGSTRGKVYTAHYLDEWHIGYTGRELSLAGSTFDFRFDAMFNSDVRPNQYVFDIMVQKIFRELGIQCICYRTIGNLF